jgi:transposase-like protein
MKKERRVFSPEDRLAILQEAQREGTTAYICLFLGISNDLAFEVKFDFYNLLL